MDCAHALQHRLARPKPLEFEPLHVEPQEFYPDSLGARPPVQRLALNNARLLECRVRMVLDVQFRREQGARGVDAPPLTCIVRGPFPVAQSKRVGVDLRPAGCVPDELCVEIRYGLKAWIVTSGNRRANSTLSAPICAPASIICTPGCKYGRMRFFQMLPGRGARTFNRSRSRKFPSMRIFNTTFCARFKTTPSAGSR